MFKVAVTLAALLGSATATELTPDNWDSATAGKTAFIKFQAPWCGHCKKLKPDWDKLMTEFDGHASILVGDVDCIGAGKPLCDSNGVKGFPTIKHGDPNDLNDYNGGRDFSALQKFASGLKPVCSPANIDLCDAEGKANIERVQALSNEELEAGIADGEQKMADAEKTFKDEVSKLQAAYEGLQKDKEDTIAAVKASGVGLMKSVLAAKKKAGHDEL